MHPGFLPIAASFSLCALLLLVLVGRRETRSPLHRTFLGFVAALVVWTGGAALFYATGDAGLRLLGRRVMWGGILLVPPLWLLLGARVARTASFEGRASRRWIALLLLPSALLYAAVLTNSRHHAFAGSMTQLDYARGPLYWLAIAWAYTCVGAGILHFLRRAHWLASHRERLRAAVVVAAALVPLAVSLVRIARATSLAWDPTPVALGLSAAALTSLVFRTSLLDSLPLVRRDVIERLGHAVVIADRAGNVLDANPAAATLLGVAGRGASLAERLAPLQPDDPEAPGRLLAPPEQGRDERVADWTLPDGRVLAVRAVHVGGGAAAEPSGLFLVARDRSAEVRHEQALRRAQRFESVGHLAAGLAHELNTPLAYVHSNLGELARRAEAAARLGRKHGGADAGLLEEMPAIARETAEGVDRMARIVASLSRLAREGETAFDAVDPAECLREALDRAALPGDGVRLVLHLDEGLPPVLGAREALVRALGQLLRNARAAAVRRPGGAGAVEVTARAAPPGVEIRVEDDGPGIPADVQERIFDPFFTTGGPDEGTGLGLALAYEVVRAHHGRVEVRSRPGGGTCFRVRLPADPGAR